MHLQTRYKRNVGESAGAWNDRISELYNKDCRLGLRPEERIEAEIYVLESYSERKKDRFMLVAKIVLIAGLLGGMYLYFSKDKNDNPHNEKKISGVSQIENIIENSYNSLA